MDKRQKHPVQGTGKVLSPLLLLAQGGVSYPCFSPLSFPWKGALKWQETFWGLRRLMWGRNTGDLCALMDKSPLALPEVTPLMPFVIRLSWLLLLLLLLPQLPLGRRHWCTPEWRKFEVRSIKKMFFLPRAEGQSLRDYPMSVPSAWGQEETPPLWQPLGQV